MAQVNSVCFLKGVRQIGFVLPKSA